MKVGISQLSRLDNQGDDDTKTQTKRSTSANQKMLSSAVSLKSSEDFSTSPRHSQGAAGQLVTASNNERLLVLQDASSS